MQNQSIAKTDVVSTETVGWDLAGKNIAPEEPKCVAKKSTTKHGNLTNNRYWIKYAVAGMNAGHIINPHAIGYIEENAKRPLERMGKKVYEFKEVKEEAFNLFMKYLETKNPLNITGAERVL